MLLHVAPDLYTRTLQVAALLVKEFAMLVHARSCRIYIYTHLARGSIAGPEVCDAGSCQIMPDL